jgi:hypothetical protein
VPLLLARRGVPPTATTNTATSVTATTATLNGTVSANGSSTTVEFEYGTSSGSYTSTTTAAQSPVTGDSVAVSASITLPGVTTYYRVKATNSTGTTYGAEQSVTIAPSNAANLVADWRYTDVSTSGATVLQMNDAAGSDDPAVGAVGERPELIADGVQFDGISERLESTTGLLGTEYTVLARFRVDTAAADSTIWSQHDALTGRVIFSIEDDGGTLRFRLFEGGGAGVVFGTSAVTSATWYTATVTRASGGGITMHINGGEEATDTHTATPPAVPFRIASYVSGGFAHMTVGAMLVYSRALTSAERQQLEGWLNSIFGI